MTAVTLYLCFEGPAHSPPWCLPTLLALSARHTLGLEVIYNGFALNYDPALSQLAPDYRSQHLPVRLSRQALLARLLEARSTASLCLFMMGDALWLPPQLENWLEPLTRFAGLSPRWATATSERESQALALAAPSEAPEFAPWTPAEPPALLVWTPTTAPALLAMLNQPGLLSLGQAQASLAWAPAVAALESQFSWQAAEQAWAAVRAGGPQALQVLAELRALSPDSPAIYLELLKSASEPLYWLEQAFSRGLLAPQLLLQAQRLYQAQGRTPEAQACAEIFAGLYDPEAEVPRDRQNLTDFLARYPALPRPARLSVCLIVKDEILTLERCLSSVAGLADELIVVDTGSSDGTPELAERLGARVIHWAWQNDFAAARNVSLAHATGDWILVLDADEYLAPAARTMLWRLLWDPPPGLPRCQLQIDNQIANDVGGLIHFVIRLFPRHRDFVYQGRIHESLAYQGPGISPTPLIKGILIQHTGYIAAVYHTRNKAERNLALLRQQQAEEPQKPEWLFYLGDSLMAAQKPAEALPWLERAINAWSHTAQSASPLALRALIRTQQAYLATDRAQSALELAQSFATVLQTVPDYWYFLGRTQQALDAEAAAVEAFNRCLACQPDDELLAYYDPNTSTSALYQLMQIYRRQLLEQRLTATISLRQVLEQMLELFADGSWQAHEFNLFTLFGQLCLAVWLQTAQLPLDWLTPYRHQIEAEASLEVLAWLSGETLLGDQRRELAVELTPSQLQSFGQSQALRQQLCEALPAASRRGIALREAIFAVSQLLAPEPETYLAYAGLCHQSHSPLRALNILSEAQMLFPQDPVLQNNLGMLQFEAGQVERAQETLQSCVQSHPDFAEARENLAQLENWRSRQ